MTHNNVFELSDVLVVESFQDSNFAFEILKEFVSKDCARNGLYRHGLPGFLDYTKPMNRRRAGRINQRLTSWYPLNTVAKDPLPISEFMT